MQASQKEVFKIILDTFVNFNRSLKTERGQERLKSLSDMSPESLEALNKAICEALEKGIRGEIEKNISFEGYQPFSDAIASELTGRINLKIQCVVKAGRRQLQDQIHFIERKRPEYKYLYPALLAEKKFNIHNDKYNYVCLMEYLADYTSFHEMIFKSENEDKWRIGKAIDSIFDILFSIYRKEYNEYSTPNLISLYLDGRIKKRLQDGKRRFNAEVKFPAKYKDVFKDFDDLLNRNIEIEETVLDSFNHCLSSIEEKINAVTPSFTTLVHGDAHPANLMINLSYADYEVKFLDPNVYIQNSDYLYDMGKMIHWLDKFGFIALERALSKQIIKVTSEPSNGNIRINYEFDLTEKTISRIYDLKNYALECVYNRIEAIADSFGDTDWNKRLNLAIAAAYIGGLTYVDKPNQFLICFIESLRYINKFLE